MANKELETLSYIKTTYGKIIASVASIYNHRPEVIAGVIMRESAGGTSPLLDVPGPEGRGDGGHGHGLGQIDDRTYPDFCRSDDWKVPEKNIDKIGKILRDIKGQIVKECKTFKLWTAPGQLEQMMVAGYNCGPDKVVHALRQKENLDTYTAHGNYSSEVLRFSTIYAMV